MPIRLLWQVLLFVVVMTTEARAETKLDFWHSYLHQPSGIVHYSFHIKSFKRGLFFGSCGLSTRSLLWEYDIDLAGPGPVYEKEQVTIASDGSKIEVASGTVSISPKQRQTTIQLKVILANEVRDFVANGVHAVGK